MYVESDLTLTTPSNTLTDIEGGIQLSNSRTTCGTVRVMLVGMKDGSAEGNDDGDYTQVSYAGTFGFSWDGTNGFFYDASGETTITTAPTRAIPELTGNTNNDIDMSGGTAPYLSISTGKLRVKVQGLADTIIHWAGKLEVVAVLA